jgi:hypothetical protein
VGTAGIVAIAVGALVVGLVLGFVLKKPQGAWTKVTHVVTRRGIILLALGAAVIGGLVALSATDVGSPQLDGQLITAVALLSVTRALFSTGELVYTPKSEFRKGTGDDEKTYTVGSSLTKAEYDNLDPSEKERVTQQHGLYFRGLYTGTDGRWSTSKVQVLLWTYAVAFGLLSIFVALQLKGGLHLDQGEGKGTTFGDLEFDDQYLLLLGGYFAAAVLAKGITTSRVESGQQVKPQVEEARSPVQGAKDLVTDDAGQGDLGDMQFFLFNVIALGVFLVSFVPHLERGMPDLPWFLVGLTSVSALAYVGKKTVESGSPTIAAVVPSRARPRDKLRIEGSYLASSGESPPTISIDGLAVAEPAVLSVAGPLGEHSVVQATVPDGVTAGEQKTVSVTPRGAKAVTAQIEIVQTEITNVEPEPVPWRQDVPVTISGKGFGSDPGPDTRDVKLGSVQLIVSDWRDEAIVAALPKRLDEKPPQEAVQLVVRRDGMEVASRSTRAGVTPMAITAVDPPSLTLVEDVAVMITGTGFGPPPGGEVTLNKVDLGVQAWSDTQVVAILGHEFPPAETPPPTCSLKVARPGYGDQAKAVAVTLPAITVTDIHPAEVPAKEGTAVSVVGTNFGRQGPIALQIGEVPMQLVDGGRSDTLLQATLGSVPANVAEKVDASSQLLKLVVSRDRWAPGSKDVTLKKPATGG